MTCEECRRKKIQGVQMMIPSILKLDANEPFEMVVIDYVSSPMTARGNIRMVIMVDHKNKFGFTVPLRNKTSYLSQVVHETLLSM